ncbi:unnamed protein product, partial [Prorocentrum cordatum]
GVRADGRGDRHHPPRPLVSVEALAHKRRLQPLPVVPSPRCAPEDDVRRRHPRRGRLPEEGQTACDELVRRARGGSVRGAAVQALLPDHGGPHGPEVHRGRGGDQRLVEFIRRGSDVGHERDLLVMDLRPWKSAWANKAGGGGFEGYPRCKLVFGGIDNIHCVRDAWRAMGAAVNNIKEDEPGTWMKDVANSCWYDYVEALRASVASPSLPTLGRGVRLLSYVLAGVISHWSISIVPLGRVLGVCLGR